MTDSSPLSPEAVTRLARLARIALTDEEVQLFGAQLNQVIDYNMALLSELDVTDVPLTAQTTGLVNQWQEDEPRLSLDQSAALSSAPAARDGQFVVKKVLGEA